MNRTFKTVFYRILPKGLKQIALNKYYLHLLNNFDEKKEYGLRILKRFVNPGDTVADIGANIGLYTKFLSSQVGPTGLVYSFEPVKRNYKILLSVMKKLRLTNVRAFNLAISNNSSQTTIHVPVDDSGRANYYEGTLNDSVTTSKSISEVVQAETLDGFTETQKISLQFIKVDVEGHEVEVIEGALETIGHQKPVLFIEVRDSFAGLLNLLLPLGYSAYWTDGLKIKRAERKSDDSHINYLFLTHDQLDEFISSKWLYGRGGEYTVHQGSTPA